MKCLNCGTEMTTNQVITNKDQISYDMCEKCGSLWLDAGELDKMAFKVDGDIEFCEQDKEKELEQKMMRCPRCDDSTLDKVRFLESDVFLHYCRNCGGFWLDGGELNLIDQELARIMPVHGKGFSDFINNVHVPYWFKRVKTRSSETDFKIEVPPIKGATMQKATTDVCPACGETLDDYTVFSMHFEGCPKCKGLWLIKDQLRGLKNKVDDGSLRWLKTEIENVGKTSVISTKRRCVACKTTNLVCVHFGKSSVLIDWCPQCHGMWLDRGEFQAMIDYLKNELTRAHPKDIEKQAEADLKRVWTGGPESRFDEALDAKAAISALINATIFEHPALFNLCMGMSRV
ncbi:MAG: zf-TFIIB domain-containing protein [Candidatus Acidiferrales bacterium]